MSVINNISDLLATWGFSKYIDDFAANGVNLEALMLLNNENSRELVPVLGERLLLLKKIQELRDSEVQVDVNEELEVCSNSSDAASSSNTTINCSNEKSPPKRRRVAGTVREYLDCPIGQMIKTNYTGPPNKPKKIPFLDTKFQNKLTERIIHKEVTNTNATLSADRLNQLAEEIVEIFPNEVKGTYFIPYATVKIDGKIVEKKAAKGKLWNKYNNQCKALLTSGTRRYRREAGNQVENTLHQDQVYDSEGRLDWLQSQNDITDRVKEYWRETCLQRIDLLKKQKGQCGHFIRRSGKCHVDSYMTRFPFLRQPYGYTLLDEDFESLFPGKFNIFFQNWPVFEKKIKFITGDETERSEARILFDFCSILTKNQPSKRVTKSWVANKQEIQEGFILHVKTIDSLLTEIDRICSRAKNNKLHVSPFAVVVGNDLENITDSYLYIDGVQFRAASPKHAVDHCMKSVHALHAVFQEQSDSVWLLLQRIAYEIKTPWDNVTPIIERLEKQFRDLDSDQTE